MFLVHKYRTTFLETKFNPVCRTNTEEGGYVCMLFPCNKKTTMKTCNRILSFVLALAIALSLVIPTASPASAAGVDTYIASCTTYASNLSVKTTSAAALMTYPCNSATNSSSSVKYTIPADTMLTVKSLVKNTANTYWYEVLYYGTTLYIDATLTTMVDHLTGDVTIANVQSPASLAYGSSFAIKGEISASQNKLGTIRVGMYANTNITKDPVMEATDTPTGNTYSLQGSAIDYALVFGNLAAGVYTYVVTAEAVSYYIDGTGALATSAQTVVLNTQECVITDWRNPNDDLAFGIDVSTWQGSINWSKTKNDIDFAILRIGYSTTLDNRFLEYAQNCENYGIPYGVYHYSYGLSVAEVTAEAQFVIDTLRANGFNPRLGVWYDMEDASQAALGTSTKEAFVMAFCDTIAEAGYKPGFYGFTSWFSSSFQKGYLASMPQWIAQIDGFSSNGTATYDGGTWLWQYSWEGSISGISGDVDCNICYADFSVFNSDSSYLSKCTQYPARAIAKTSDTVNLRQYPSTGHTSLGSLSANMTLEVTGLYQNANGEYWYQVVAGDQAGYVHSDYVTITEFTYDDLAVIDPTMASNLNIGSGYYLQGKLVSKWNTIHTTYAKVYSGEDTLTAPVLSSSYANNSKNYNLYRSTVCNKMVFGLLAEGYYTYEISADVKNYYVNNGTLTSETENVVLWTAPFTVGNASVTPPANVICDHNIVTDPAKAPTCTETGLTEGSHCSKCGVVFVSQTTVPAKGHSYTVTSTPANCKNYEIFHYSCANCGDKYDVSADTLANNWSEVEITGLDASRIQTKTQYRYADCTSTKWEKTGSGTIKYVNSWPSGFSTSSSIYSQYNKKSSKVSDSETDTAKTTVTGDSVCGYLYYHWCYADSYYSMPYKSGSYTSFHAYYDTTDPSNYTCDTSDMSYKTAHSTCSNSEWWFVAEVYGQTYDTYQKVPANDGKEWGAWSAWSDTVYTPIENTRKVETRTMYRLANAELGDHSYKAVVTKPTCSKSGYTTYTCTACGDSYTSDQTSAVDHSYVNGKCTWCGAAEPITELDYYLIGYINGKDYGCESDSANMGEYKFVDGKLTATFASDSYVFIKTTNNANWYMTDGWLGTETTTATFYNTTLDIEHNKLFVPGGVEVTFTLVVNEDDTLTLSYAVTETPIEKIDIAFSQIDMGNTLGMRFAFPASADINWTGAYVVATMGGNTQTIPATEWETANIGGTNHYVFGFNNIAAKQMADEISIVIYNADGKAVSNEYVDSIQSYVMRNVDKKDAEAKALMVDMLNYGAAAQTYYGYNTSDLANAQLTDAQKAYGTATKPEITDGRVKGANYLGTRLELGSSIGMQMNFKGTTANMYAVVEFTNHSGTKVSERVAPTEISGTYLIVIDQIVVADGRMPITVTVYNANGTVYGSATDSMASYIARMSNADALYECIMKFSDSAHAYLH